MLLNTVEGVRAVDEVLTRHVPHLRHRRLRPAAPPRAAGGQPADHDRRAPGAVDRTHPDGHQRDVRRVRPASASRSCSSSAASPIPEMWSGIVAARPDRRRPVPGVPGRRTRVLRWYRGLKEVNVTADDPSPPRPSGRRRADAVGARPEEGLPGEGGEIEAVRDLTFDVAAGELVCVVGPSGAGKTTLLRASPACSPRPAARSRSTAQPVTGPPQGMAVVFQEYGRSLFPWMTRARERRTAAEGQAACPGPSAPSSSTRRSRRSGSTDAPTAYPWQLSGGMQQRVAIARAVAYEPAGAADGRAVRRGRRADPRRPGGPGPRHLAATRRDHPVRHPRHRRVGLPRRSACWCCRTRPTVVQEDLTIDLPDERDQIATRSSARFTELRTHVWEQIQLAKASKPAGTVPTAKGAH